MARYSFSEPGCFTCPAHDTRNGRYCRFKNRRKRFWSRDPKYKAPKWCPRRKNPADLRVYRLKDKKSEFFHFEFNSPGNNRKPLSLSPHHYIMTHEQTLKITAKGLFEAGRLQDGDLTDFTLKKSDIIEIDNGLVSFFFYCAGSLQRLRPVTFAPLKEQPAGRKSGK